jgi:hypothetical protein
MYNTCRPTLYGGILYLFVQSSCLLIYLLDQIKGWHLKCFKIFDQCAGGHGNVVLQLSKIPYSPFPS